MKTKNAAPKRLDILRGRRTAAAELDAGTVRAWRKKIGYFSLFAGISAMFASQPQDAVAAEDAKAVPPRVKAKAAELLKKLNSGACSKPALLRRQTEYRLPHQQMNVDMVELFAGSDTCPGSPIPNGTYTVAAPFTDSGTTIGANNTVTAARIGTAGCIEGLDAVYASVQAPDHIYSFTLSARGTNPQITVDGAGNYDVSTYILSNTGEACPAGTGNQVTNCLVGTDINFDGSPELINTAKMQSLPLNVPLYLFVDSFYPGATPTTSNAGPYTVTIQDVTIGGGPQPPANDAPIDVNADGKSDFQLVRNVGGGVSGQLRWYTAFQDGFPTSTTDWGIASDFPVSGDFDGDGKDDFAVYRPGTPGTFYVVRSASATMYVEPFGVEGDDPTVVGDYTGDNRDDLAVYRSGTTPGAQSTWFYRSIGPASQATAVQWGQTGDTPAPGDYDGDGRYDFVIQRDDANGVNGRFFIRTATGAQTSEMFGLKTDTLVPGDYDDDGKTDLATVRDQGGFIRWQFEPSGTAGSTEVFDLWGVSATDFVTQGDYDGDGRTDYAVWREGNPGRFFIMTVGTRVITTSGPWGQVGDRPVAEFNTH